MAEPNYNAGLEKVAGAIENNRDWAMKAYSVANDERRLQMAQQQNDIQMKAQQLAIGEKRADMMRKITTQPEGSIKQALIKSFQETDQGLGLSTSPEFIAAMKDKTTAPEIAKALAWVAGRPNDPVAQRALMGLAQTTDYQQVLQAAQNINKMDTQAEITQLRGENALARAQRSESQQEIKGIGDLRREYNQNVTGRFKTQEDAIKSIEGLLTMKANKFSDQALMGRFQAAAEGVSSVLREEDIKRYGGSVGILDRLEQEKNKVLKSETYTPEARKLLGEVNGLLKKKLQEGKYDAGLAIKEEADARGVPYERVFGTDAPLFKNGQTASAGSPATSNTVSARAPVTSGAPATAASVPPANAQANRSAILSKMSADLKSGLVNEAGLIKAGVPKNVIDEAKRMK